VIGSGAAIPLSGGTSTAITYLAVAASTASTAQCLNGIARTTIEAVAPKYNDYLDSKEWYKDITLALDVISLAGAATLKTVKVLSANSNKSIPSILTGLSRAERKRLTQDVIRLNTPGISNKLLKSMVKSGHFPSRYSNLEITRALTLQLKDAIGASMSFAGSGLSGTVNSLAVGIYEELAQ